MDHQRTTLWISHGENPRPTILKEVLGAAVRWELSGVVDVHIRLFCRVGGVAKAPVMVVVQPVIKHERRGRGGRPGPHAGLCTAHVERLNSWQRAVWAGVVR